MPIETWLLLKAYRNSSRRTIQRYYRQRLTTYGLTTTHELQKTTTTDGRYIVPKTGRKPVGCICGDAARQTSIRTSTSVCFVLTCITRAGCAGGLEGSWTPRVIWTALFFHSTRSPAASSYRAGRTARHLSTCATPQTTCTSTDSTTTVQYYYTLSLVVVVLLVVVVVVVV